jgi:hypothetical protein
MKTTRRQLLKTAAATSAAIFAPRGVLGGGGGTSPNEKLNIAGIGVGGMGNHNLKACSAENIVALCDVDQNYAAKTFKEYPKAKVYRDFREMLDKQKDIDAVIVATPDHSHAVIALAAIRAGKHVYVQKPLTYSVYEARVLTEAARERKVATQMGNQGHSGDGTSEPCVKSMSGRTAPSGPRGWKWSVPRRRRRSRPASIGTCGSVPLLTGRIIQPTCRAIGGRGAISARARWATWAVTCSTRRSGR